MYIYLSPHLDDVIFSCGGIISLQKQLGEVVEIWTIFAGQPVNLSFSAFAEIIHTRSGYGAKTVEGRQIEDIAACRRLGCRAIHLDYREAVYRSDGSNTNWLYPTRTSIFEPVTESDVILGKNISRELKKRLSKDAQIVAPLGIGGHVDHLIVRAAAESVKENIFYYEDFPYAARHNQTDSQYLTHKCRKKLFPVRDFHIHNWHKAIMQYPSQLGRFWQSKLEMRKAVWNFYKTGRGDYLWQTLERKNA